MNFRDIGGLIDLLIPLALAVFFILAKRGQAPENEKQAKAIRIMRICGWALLALTIARIIYEYK